MDSHDKVEEGSKGFPDGSKLVMLNKHDNAELSRQVALQLAEITSKSDKTEQVRLANENEELRRQLQSLGAQNSAQTAQLGQMQDTIKSLLAQISSLTAEVSKLGNRFPPNMEQSTASGDDALMEGIASATAIKRPLSDSLIHTSESEDGAYEHVDHTYVEAHGRRKKVKKSAKCDKADPSAIVPAPATTANQASNI